MRDGRLLYFSFLCRVHAPEILRPTALCSMLHLRLPLPLQFKPIAGFIYVRVAEVCLPPSGSLLSRSPFLCVTRVSRGGLRVAVAAWLVARLGFGAALPVLPFC